MRSFDELVAEAEAVDLTGWGFGWLEGRATEERPPWGYSQQLADRLRLVGSALDIDTGGGELIAEMPLLPPRMCVTEAWPPNLAKARALLQPRGVDVTEGRADHPLPFPEHSFALVSSRHPVNPRWSEIFRVLEPGGAYFAQHVGPWSAVELIEWFLGARPHGDHPRTPETEAAAARAAGLIITSLETARCRMEFFDIGAVVYVLRKCVWWVPDFDVDRYRERLLALHRAICDRGSFVAHSTRHLIEATRFDG